MALALVTLQRAKSQLRVTDNAHDDDITQKMTAASEEIVAYLNTRADPTWDTVANPPPRPVEEAILTLTTDYFWNRGDDMAKDADVWVTVRRMLATYRDPTVA